MRVGGTFNITLGTPSPQAMPRVVFSGWATGRHSLKAGSELAMVTHTAHCLAVTLQCAPRPNNPWEGVLTTPGHREAASGSKAQWPTWAMAWPSGWGPLSARAKVNSLAPRSCSRVTFGGHEGHVSLWERTLSRGPWHASTLSEIWARHTPKETPHRS